MVRAALIGLGKMGISHCSILGAHPDVELVGVCDASKFVLLGLEKYTPFPCFSDYRKMLDQTRPDCVFIATPTKLHHSMVMDALQRGIHVFCEKPFCLTPEEGEEMTAEAKTRGLVTQVGYHNRFLGTFREAKRLIEAGVIGEVVHILGEAYGPVVLKSKGGTWRADYKEGGGCLFDYASHVVNPMQYFVGSPNRVAGTVLKRIFSETVDDAVYSTLFYDNGLSGQMSVNWSDESYRKMSTQISIFGKQGKIIVDAVEMKIYLRQAVPSQKLDKGWSIRWLTDLTPTVDFYLRGEEYSAQVDYFIQCVKEGRHDPLLSFSSALETDQVVHMLLDDGLQRR